MIAFLAAVGHHYNDEQQTNKLHYINKISFYRAVKIVVGYDILEGEIVNVRVVEGSTRNSRLMKAIATYLEDASFITDKRSVKGCTLPIRIEV